MCLELFVCMFVSALNESFILESVDIGIGIDVILIMSSIYVIIII